MTESPGTRLAGKHALITGGAGGIGAATAALFLREGASVALLDRDEKGLAKVVRELGAPASRLMSVVASLDDEVETIAGVAEAVAKLGRLDVLVNNAAARNYGAVADVDATSWDRVLRVNVVAAGTCAREALPFLRQSGRGAIVNVSSAFALIGRRGMGQYDASKAALVALTRALAAEEAQHGVRANAVCPGSILTPYTKGRAAVRNMTEAELVERGSYPCLLERWGTAEEVAAPILWLASDEASFITGAALAVDGGLSGSLP
jgi:2-hydroxycyclohexanecarboxyl-CoA dehydrogenase